MIDAFYADAIPFHLVTREFLELVRSRLDPGGVVVTNMIGAVTGERVATVPVRLPDLPNRLPDRARPPGDDAGRPGRTPACAT